jgi:hypothetical protein
MFVKFRLSKYRLDVSLVSGSRINGKVRQQHVASLGSIKTPMTVAGRVAFWRSAHERLARLANRIGDGESKIAVQIGARIPFCTMEDRQNVQASNAQAEERFGSKLHDAHSRTLAQQKELAAQVAKDVAGRRGRNDDGCRWSC